MGETGSGKSRLSIDLASHFAGVEVINADSMQVYQGLDVLTNKVPFLERDNIYFPFIKRKRKKEIKIERASMISSDLNSSSFYNICCYAPGVAGNLFLLLCSSSHQYPHSEELL
ncbi:uncharacterized protein LOC109849470 [Asparagus officinalis]|uniref:uncharacterized protein LOC109849470 n=1 Tax=Asparagus officinalis TaxID=4686 RepID=UPI00098DE996|nr:uncharacterized protein LOC109849470 [Asparagus officinalis]